MDYLLADEFREPAQDLFHDVEDLFLFELFAFHEFFEVSVLAVLGDDVEAVFGTEHVFEFYDVGVVEPFEQVNFRKDGVF